VYYAELGVVHTACSADCAGEREAPGMRCGHWRGLIVMDRGRGRKRWLR